MSIADKLEILEGDIKDIYEHLELKGATMPDKKNTGNINATVDTIPQSEAQIKPFLQNCELNQCGAYYSAKTVGLSYMLVRGTGQPSVITTSGPTAYTVGSDVYIWDAETGEPIFSETSMKSATDLPVGYFVPMNKCVLWEADANGNILDKDKMEIIYSCMTVVDNAGAKVWRYFMGTKSGQYITLPAGKYYVFHVCHTAVLCSQSGGPTGTNIVYFSNCGFDFVKVLGTYFANDTTGTPSSKNNVWESASDKIMFLASRNMLYTYSTVELMMPYSGQTVSTSGNIAAYKITNSTTVNPLNTSIPDIRLNGFQPTVKFYFPVEKIAQVKSGYYKTFKLGANSVTCTSNMNTSTSLTSFSMNKGSADLISTTPTDWNYWGKKFTFLA